MEIGIYIGLTVKLAAYSLGKYLNKPCRLQKLYGHTRTCTVGGGPGLADPVTTGPMFALKG